MEALHFCEAVDLDPGCGRRGLAGRQYRPEAAKGGRKDQPRLFPLHGGRSSVSVLAKASSGCTVTSADVSERGSYFQGARSTPRPIRLVRHAGHGPWDETARSALALSKMNWNNDALYDPLAGDDELRPRSSAGRKADVWPRFLALSISLFYVAGQCPLLTRALPIRPERLWCDRYA